tara:strand:- start:405 stop:587 length:183 start_codon:yes stop_codon:yes gene_type:complete
MKKQGLFKMSVNTQLKTEELWDLSAEILTELSRRDGVSYRVQATEESVSFLLQTKLEETN